MIANATRRLDRTGIILSSPQQANFLAVLVQRVAQRHDWPNANPCLHRTPQIWGSPLSSSERDSPQRTRGVRVQNRHGIGVQSRRIYFLAWVAGWPSGAPAGRGTICAYCAVIPPSITSSEPVTQDDSSEARNSTPLAISSAVPSRPIGVRSSSSWRTSGSLKRFAVSGVFA